MDWFEYFRNLQGFTHTTQNGTEITHVRLGSAGRNVSLMRDQRRTTRPVPRVKVTEMK